MDAFDAIVLALAALAGLLVLFATHGGGRGSELERRWRQLSPHAIAYVKRSPATFVYAAILCITGWVIAGAGDRLASELLRSQSTNLANLRDEPLTVLFRSAFWAGDLDVLPVFLVVLVVLAPVECWLGTGRTVGAFLIGHVGATLITAGAIDRGYFGSPGHHGLVRTIDVGVSYGVFCVGALLSYRMPPRYGLPYALLLVTASAVFAFAFDSTFNDFGHFVSVLIGLALYPITRGERQQQRRSIPFYRPWLVGEAER